MANFPGAAVFVRYWPEQRFGTWIHTNLVINTPKVLPPQYLYELAPQLPFNPQEFIQQNYTVLTAAAVTLMPPQSDYPLPTDLRPWWPIARAQSVPQTITVPSQPPIAQRDWPLPIRPYLVQADLSEFEANVQLLLSVQPPRRQDQWPLPTPPYRVYSQSYASPLSLLRAQVPPPSVFAQDDWPIPKRLPPVFYAQNYPSPYCLITFVSLPFNLYDWPKPTPPPVVRAEAQSAYLQLLLSLQPPIAQLDWPLPIQPYKVYAQSYSSPQVITFVPQTPPNNKTDWPVPIQHYRVYAEVRSAFIPLLHSVQPPIAQLDWPLPIQPPRVYAQSYGIAAVNLTAPTPPIAQYDWPNPRPPYRVYAEVRSSFIPLLRSIQPPNAQLSWPLPTLQQPYRVYAEVRSAFYQLISAKPPNRQSDWPPPREPYRVYPRFYGIPTTLTVIVPAVQRDWPLPKQPPRVSAESYRVPLPLIAVQAPRGFSRGTIIG